MRTSIVLFACSLWLTGCVVVHETPPPNAATPAPPPTTLRTIEAREPIELGAPASGTLAGLEVGYGHAIALRGGAALDVRTGSADAHVAILGPAVTDTEWKDTPSIASVIEPTFQVTVPSDGTYLFVVSGNGPYELRLECRSGECRLECPPDPDPCIAGAHCNRVVCVRAPCPSFCAADAPGGGCTRQGCGNTVCAEADAEIMTTCLYAPWHDCLTDAACTRQPNGQCGFSQTPELEACLRSHGGAPQ
jgi:hypothetical protein